MPLRQGSVPTGYKQTEVGIIPEEWEVSELECVARIIDPQPDHRTPPAASAGEPYIGISDFINDSTVNWDGSRKIISSAVDKQQASFRIRRGDIIFGKIGTIGSPKFLPAAPFRFGLSANVLLIQPAIESYFVMSWLRSKTCQSAITGELHSTSQAAFGINKMRRVLIPLPNESERRNIAEALSDADALIESMEQLLAKKRNLKQGAMQELLTGKKRLPGFSGKWDEKLFGEITQPRKERIDPRRTGLRGFCIELEHIEQGTGCLAGCTATSAGSSLKSVFQKDDVLFGKLRAYLRKYWFANREGVCSTEIWVLTAKRELLIPEFLFQLVKVDRFIEAASSAYGTHMPRSDWNVVKYYEVRLPKIPEQTAIAAILSDMDAEIAALEAKLAKARRLKQGMMQELLTGRIRLV